MTACDSLNLCVSTHYHSGCGVLIMIENSRYKRKMKARMFVLRPANLINKFVSLIQFINKLVSQTKLFVGFATLSLPIF